jgi:ankyrin repeat protein
MEHVEEFLTAVKQGQAEQVAALLAQEPGLAGARDENGTSAVLLATYYGQPEIVQVLRQQGVTLDIFEAATLGDLAQVQALVQGDSSLVNAYAPDGFYPLGLACFFGHSDVAHYLLQQGADVNQAARNPQKVQSLHAASANGNYGLVRELVERGADVNGKQSNDFTPLHNAAQTGNLAMVQLFIDHGADVNAMSLNGLTPLSFAVKENHAEVADLLRRHGGK